MAEFVFTSPGAKFRERDLTFIARNVGVTTLGVVGETQKGAAFEPIFIQDQGEFLTRFGGQNTEKFPNSDLKYQTPYVANAYLEESNQLWVTRVLGLSGYDAGTHWALTLSAGVDPISTGDTTGITSNNGVSFSGGSYLGVSITAINDTGTTFTGFTKSGVGTGATFSGERVDFTAVTYTASTTSGTVDEIRTTVSGLTWTKYEGIVLGVVRPRATVTDVIDTAPTTTFDADTLTMTANNTLIGIGNMFAEFEITALDSTDSSTEVFTVSLDPNAASYLPNVLGGEPKDKNSKLWNEAVFPDLIKKADAESWGYGINTTIIDATSDAFINYNEQYKTPETPYIVSELRGNTVERLFKCISISDGDAANREIKISITNIDPVSGEFNVLVRDFNDSDANIIVLESFTRCTMTKGETNYVGNRIGTSNGDYALKSSYIMLQINNDASVNAFPAGFEGYNFKDYATSATSSSTAGLAPLLLFKQSFNTDDKLNKVYLGISETAYNASNLTTNGFNQNYFNYNGQSAFVKTRGYHMDSGTTGTGYTNGAVVIGAFEVGAGNFRVSADIASGAIYEDIDSRKFTIVPYNGFDGWDEHRQARSNGDLFRVGGIYDGVVAGATPSNDFQAWEMGVNKFANPEDVTINIFATPGLNWSDNLVLINNNINMIENERADSLYIIDAPDIDIAAAIGTRVDVVVANDITNLLSITSIDSSYSATYYPWIQIPDTQNNVNIFLPPTGEVVKALAFTDNVKFPWFATAGVQRGVTAAKKSKYKLSERARDIIYKGRINPLADFTDVGTTIFGQKTLQVKESALDRINVRRLLLQVKVLISNIAIRLLFEQNDQTTIDQFLAKANPTLDSIKRERGLQEFKIKMDESINTPESLDRNELFGEILLKPTRSLEFIGITFIITPSGASFENI